MFSAKEVALMKSIVDLRLPENAIPMRLKKTGCKCK
jgi:hypothetical protein